jgi:hypothetical protein
MDGFETNEGRHPHRRHEPSRRPRSALLRPGRFDRRVVVPRPDVKGREGILKVHMRRVPIAENVDITLLARQTPGFAGADLENLVNEAALLAARRNKEKVDMGDFEIAKDKVMMGSERRSMIISDEERRTTAYHEAGHALVAKLVPGTDPVHKVTIIPRGMALGLTQQVPLDDRHTYSREYLVGDLAVFFGGRAAEELVLGSVTTGAGNDIERATDPRAEDGLRVGHEREARAHDVRQEGRGDLPRPRLHAAHRLLGDHGGPDRRRGAAPADGRVRAREAAAPSQRRRAPSRGRGAARARVARRRGDRRDPAIVGRCTGPRCATA